MYLTLINDLEKHLLDTKGAEISINPEICPPNMEGDITVNCFRFAKDLKSNPMQAAQEICDFLNNHDDVEKAEVIKAFINVTIKSAALSATQWQAATLPKNVFCRKPTANTC